MREIKVPSCRDSAAETTGTPKHRFITAPRRALFTSAAPLFNDSFYAPRACRAARTAGSASDERSYVMHRLCVIANNYLIPARASTKPLRPLRLLARKSSPRVRSVQRASRCCPQTRWTPRRTREETSQYLKVKPSDWMAWADWTIDHRFLAVTVESRPAVPPRRPSGRHDSRAYSR